jgi:biotin carboxyl carrier protein
MSRFIHPHQIPRNERLERWYSTALVFAVYTLVVLAVLALMHLVTNTAGGANVLPTEPQPMPVVIVSPWDGEFYAGEYPGSQPFVHIGSEVTPQTVVGKIDAMRLLEVKAGVVGTISDILVTDGEMVEAGQPLFVVRPPLPPI